MLTARPSKRKGTPFSMHDLRFDLFEGEKPVGKLVYDRRDMSAALTLDSASFTVARAGEDEALHQTLIRVLKGGPKPAAQPWVLKDASGEILALGAELKQAFAVSRGAESFVLRKRSFFSRPFYLYRHGSDEPLGSVGQEKFFTTALHMRLPGGFDAAFQVFLLVLLLNLTMRSLE